MAENDSAKVSILKYDAHVMIAKFNSTIARGKLYEGSYYEIIKGLQSISITGSISSMGTASITIIPPLKNDKEENIPDFNILKRYNSSVNTFKNVKNNDGVSSFVQVTDNSDNDPGEDMDSPILSSDIRYTKQKNVNFYYPILDKNMMNCIFKPMDKIKIWMSNRFQGENIDKSDIDNIDTYSVCFVGLINDVTVSYNNGSVQINISAKDLTRWLELSQFNVNPALCTSLAGAKVSDVGVTWTSNNLAQKDIKEIIKILIIGTQKEEVIIDEKTDLEYQAALKQNSTLAKIKFPKKADGNRYKLLPPVWGCGHFILLPKNDGVNGESGTKEEIQLDTGIMDDTLWIDPVISRWEPYRLSFNSFSLFEWNWRPRLEVLKEIAVGNDFEFYCDMDGKLIFKCPDYNINPGAKISEQIEVYEDKGYQLPSDYLNVDGRNIILSDDRYLIKQNEILSYSTNENDDSIVTMVSLQGDYKFETMDQVLLSNTDWEQSLELAKQFGLRIFKKNIPLLDGIDKAGARRIFAKSYMNRKNAEYKTMKLTIPLRPELKLGKTMAILPAIFNIKVSDFNSYVNTLNDKTKESALRPITMDMPVYYISGISHNYSVGDLCTTTLTLTHGRTMTSFFGELSFIRSNVDVSNVPVEYFSPDDIQAGATAKDNMAK